MSRIEVVAQPRSHRRGRRAIGLYASGRPHRATRREEVATPRPVWTAAKRILVVDDEAAVRMICTFNLEAAGLRVREAVDGDEALAIALQEQPDLILLDVMMPGRDGWSVASELRADARTRNVPIVFLTARVDEVDRRRAYDVGAVGYITKPFDPVALADRLERILDRLARGEREQLRQELLRQRES